MGARRQDGAAAGAVEHPKCPAHEVEEFDHFSRSLSPRESRAGVRHRVGACFRHREHGYLGVIVGWDARARAPDEWFAAMSVSDAKRERPFYASPLSPLAPLLPLWG